MDGIYLSSPEAAGKRSEPRFCQCFVLALIVFTLSLAVSIITSLVAYRLALKEFTAGQGKDDHVEDASKVLDGIQTTEVDQSSETKLSTADLEIIQNMLMNHSFQSFNVSEVVLEQFDDRIKQIDFRLDRMESLVQKLSSNSEDISSEVRDLRREWNVADGREQEESRYLSNETMSMLLSLRETMSRELNLIRELNRSRVHSLFTSKILSSVMIERINSYFKQKGLVPQQFTLLYRGSEQDFSSTAFHARCDKRGPTLVLIKSASDKSNPTGQVFGGFTSAQWQYSDAHLQGSINDFLFSLEWEDALFIKSTNIGNAISTGSHIGPKFGLNPEIQVGHECHKHKQASISILGSKSSTYQEPKGGADSFVKGDSKNFLCEEYEVYSVQFYQQ
ncbi:uncharacterized protein LOC142342107 [Convolutriloba macropyga]|uniref:uncharacterized protein LOC142342107 n=1 Tax=Convolutriloba macropyga TaxID=536237 RepID=UPI003F5288D6